MYHRPRQLLEFVGQEQTVNNLIVFIKSARARAMPLEHVLLYGPPGVGKTTLAAIIAQELGVNFKATSGPILAKPKDLIALLNEQQDGDILFIDEIHRLNITTEEVLYTAMEDFKLDILVGANTAAKTLRIDIARFTLIGATTRIGMLSQPLQDRFGIKLELSEYHLQDIKRILHSYAKTTQLYLHEAAADVVAKSSRGIPRIALAILRRIADYAIVHGSSNYNNAGHSDAILERSTKGIIKGPEIDLAITKHALERLNIDQSGLTAMDRRYLQALSKQSGPCGVETLGSLLSESSDTIEHVIEPYLLRLGFINKTSRGRNLTQYALDHLKLTNS